MLLFGCYDAHECSHMQLLMGLGLILYFWTMGACNSSQPLDRDICQHALLASPHTARSATCLCLLDRLAPSCKLFQRPASCCSTTQHHSRLGTAGEARS